jgi:ubiquinol-cytochrome c reductase cytochrome b subunit
LKRFFIFHFLLPFVLLIFIIIHIFYLHLYSSNNPLKLNINNKISFFPFILYKDLFTLFLILFIYVFQIYFGIYSLSHPDNALEACALVTPLHIVPEWYFLCQYAMLKTIPNKNAGFIILLTSILILYIYGEIRNLSVFIRLIHCNNNFIIILLFLIYIYLLWIGAQFPQEKYLSYGRILTLQFYYYHFYYLISLINSLSL